MASRLGSVGFLCDLFLCGIEGIFGIVLEMGLFVRWWVGLHLHGTVLKNWVRRAYGLVAWWLFVVISRVNVFVWCSLAMASVVFVFNISFVDSPLVLY